MKKNDWEERFGAKRRAIDRAIMAEWERQATETALGGPSPDSGPPTPPEPETPASEPRKAVDEVSAAERIASIFGRPLARTRH